MSTNPDDLDIEGNLNQSKRTFKNIEIKNKDELLEDARKLDQYQKKILHIGIKYAEDILIFRKGNISYPKAPLIICHGGAGSGKSTVIHVLSQHIQHILKRDGYNPDCPYVILGAFTGSAASNIQGQTLHTLFSFNFGAGYHSLNDKQRDQKRTL